MTEKIHFVITGEPIPYHGLVQTALCGHLVVRAQPIVIIPDAIVVSIGIIASTFGSKMCRKCQELEPGEGYCYFMATAEQVEELRRKLDYQEVG